MAKISKRFWRLVEALESRPVTTTFVVSGATMIWMKLIGRATPESVLIAFLYAVATFWALIGLRVWKTHAPVDPPTQDASRKGLSAGAVAVQGWMDLAREMMDGKSEKEEEARRIAAERDAIAYQMNEAIARKDAQLTKVLNDGLTMARDAESKLIRYSEQYMEAFRTVANMDIALRNSEHATLKDLPLEQRVLLARAFSMGFYEKAVAWLNEHPVPNTELQQQVSKPPSPFLLPAPPVDPDQNVIS